MAEPQFTDAIALLKADHRKVEDLFEKYRRGEGRFAVDDIERILGE